MSENNPEQPPSPPTPEAPSAPPVIEVTPFQRLLMRKGELHLILEKVQKELTRLDQAIEQLEAAEANQRR